MVANPTSPSSGSVRIEPFGRPVTVRFHDAVVASSERAWRVSSEGRPSLVFMPFEDCYSTFMDRTGEEETIPGIGTCVAWRVHAQNRAEDRAIWLLEQPEAAAAELTNHATFDPKKLAVDTD